MLEEIGKVISTLGFPIAVASFLLVRMNGKVGALGDSLRDLAEHVRASTAATRDLSDAFREYQRKD